MERIKQQFELVFCIYISYNSLKLIKLHGHCITYDYKYKVKLGNQLPINIGNKLPNYKLNIVYQKNLNGLITPKNTSHAVKLGINKIK